MNEQFEQHAADTRPASSTALPIDHQGCLSELQLVDIVVFFLCYNSQLGERKRRGGVERAAGENPEKVSDGKTKKFRWCFKKNK